jgi:Flp pilus assembly protein TadB
VSYLPPPRLLSDDVDVRSPFSIVGAQKRVWSITRTVKPLTIPLAIILAIIVFPLTLVWAIVILLLAPIAIPWRAMRRSARNTKKAAIQHKEVLDAIR